VFVSLTPSFIVDETPAQYVTTVSDPTATSFYGKRYVFAFIKTRTLSSRHEGELDFQPESHAAAFHAAIHRERSLLLVRGVRGAAHFQRAIYGQDVGTIIRTPATAVSSATYTADPDGAGPAPAFSFGDPDFTFRSLIGNAVVRWEYRPGSPCSSCGHRAGPEAIPTAISILLPRGARSSVTGPLTCFR